MEIPVDPNELSTRLQRLDSAAASMETQIEVRSGSAADIFVGHEFTRASRLFRAALVLLEKDMPAEALVLARPIVETLLRLRQVVEADVKGREAIALGWEYEGTKRIEWLGENASRLGLPPEEWMEHRDRIRQQIRLYEETLGVTTAIPQGARQFAEQSGDEEALRDFFELQVLHQFTHGSRVVRGFFETIEEGGRVSIGRVENPSGLGLLAGLQLADAFGTIVKLTAEHFGVDVPPDIEDLRGFLRELSEKGHDALVGETSDPPAGSG